MSKTQEMCNSFKSFKAVASMWLWPAWYLSVNHNETGNNLIVDYKASSANNPVKSTNGSLPVPLHIRISVDTLVDTLVKLSMA